uniref:Uncharacterized protein n=1 Tax=Oryza brachyantha TaxID=4533 RepID=J3KXV9_ORYBR
MESFTFLKFLRGGAAAGNRAGAVAATTIAASACEDGGGGGGGEVDDDASFFDLEFAVPGDESAASDAEEERVEFNFSVAGDVESGGEVVAVDDAVAPCGGEPGDAKVVELVSEAAPPPASFLKPATKFRVLLLKLRKPKVPVAAECNGGGSPAPKTNRFLIKFRVDDAPFVSLFTRDNSSRSESPLLRTMSDPRDGGWADTKDGGGGGGDGAAGRGTVRFRRYGQTVIAVLKP